MCSFSWSSAPSSAWQWQCCDGHIAVINQCLVYPRIKYPVVKSALCSKVCKQSIIIINPSETPKETSTLPSMWTISYSSSSSSSSSSPSILFPGCLNTTPKMYKNRKCEPHFVVRCLTFTPFPVSLAFFLCCVIPRRVWSYSAPDFYCGWQYFWVWWFMIRFYSEEWKCAYLWRYNFYFEKNVGLINTTHKNILENININVHLFCLCNKIFLKFRN